MRVSVYDSSLIKFLLDDFLFNEDGLRYVAVVDVFDEIVVLL